MLNTNRSVNGRKKELCKIQELAHQVLHFHPFDKLRNKKDAVRVLPLQNGAKRTAAFLTTYMIASQYGK